MDLGHLNGSARRPLPLEWRRHSFVRVRQATASERSPAGTPGRMRRFEATQLAERVARTTQDDIAW
jgi:hypothetical protein